MPNHIPLYHPLVADEQMHPTILNDFQAFETFPPTPQPSTSSSLPASSTSMFNLFDFPSTGYSQPGDAQSLQMSFTDMSPFVTGASAQSGMYQSPTQQESLGATSGQPYILDATWQDFVEQLGF